MTAKVKRHIQCLGTGPEVPKYLRFQGKVRNRRMAKRDAEKAVRDIWSLKMQHDLVSDVLVMLCSPARRTCFGTPAPG